MYLEEICLWLLLEKKKKEGAGRGEVEDKNSRGTISLQLTCQVSFLESLGNQIKI